MPNTFTRRLAVAALAALLLFVCGCAKRTGLKVGEEVAVATDTFSFDRDTYPSKQDIFPEYRLTPGDVLDVLFQIRDWDGTSEFKLEIDNTVAVKFVHMPELNETQSIQPDGKISLPYVGQVEIAGLTVEQANERIHQAYDGVLRNPEVYLVVTEYRNRIKELKTDLHTASRGLSRLVTVRPDGYCTFPIAGDLFVSGKTVPEVKKALDDTYGQFLPGLHVDLFLEQHSGSKVYVMGSVRQGGAFDIAKPMTIMEAVSLAGGLDNDAEPEEVMVFRRKDRTVYARRIDLAQTLNGASAGAAFYLKPDDILYVPRSRISEAAQVMQEIGQVLMFRGWGVSLDTRVDDWGSNN